MAEAAAVALAMLLWARMVAVEVLIGLQGCEGRW